ncbi:hypothetical protein LTR17_008654 [Elasticomyces elasticus]|nr:hypothetical protein LTR17_008654 [Elasticomyces elasticus]
MSLQWLSNTGKVSPLPAAANETFVMGCYSEMWSQDQSQDARVQHANAVATVMQNIPESARTRRQETMLRDAMCLIGSSANQSISHGLRSRTTSGERHQQPIVPGHPLLGSSIAPQQFSRSPGDLDTLPDAPTTSAGIQDMAHEDGKENPILGPGRAMATPGPNTPATALPTTNAAADSTSAPSPPQSSLAGPMSQARDVDASSDRATYARKFGANFTNVENTRLAEMVYNHKDSDPELEEGLRRRTLSAIWKHMQTNRWKKFYTEYCRKREAGQAE